MFKVCQPIQANEKQHSLDVFLEVGVSVSCVTVENSFCPQSSSSCVLGLAHFNNSRSYLSKDSGGTMV